MLSIGSADRSQGSSSLSRARGYPSAPSDLTEPVAELLLQRGFEVSHETIRAWEVRFAPLLDNALAESVIGLYKAELVERKGPWRGLDDLEYATLEWVDWFNHRRLFSAIGYVPPAEYEANLYRGTVPAEAGTQ